MASGTILVLLFIIVHHGPVSREGGQMMDHLYHFFFPQLNSFPYEHTSYYSYISKYILLLERHDFIYGFIL